MRARRFGRSWEQAMEARRSRLDSHGRRKAAVIDIRPVGTQPSDYVEVEKMRVTVAYDDMDGDQRSCDLMISQWRASRDSSGVCWGGPDTQIFSETYGNCTTEQRNCRLSRRQQRETSRLLDLESSLVVAGRCRGKLPSSPVFPELWAGFTSRLEDEVELGGPAFEEFLKRWDWPSEVVKRIYSRQHVDGLVLLPATWVIDSISDAVAVFAKLDSFPKQQSMRLSPSLDELVGEEYGIKWDFSPLSRSEFGLVSEKSTAGLNPQLIEA